MPDAAGFTWDAKILDKYLENPYSVVPGAAMGLLNGGSTPQG